MLIVGKRKPELGHIKLYLGEMIDLGYSQDAVPGWHDNLLYSQVAFWMMRPARITISTSSMGIFIGSSYKPNLWAINFCVRGSGL
jgi:hypothetical protein